MFSCPCDLVKTAVLLTLPFCFVFVDELHSRQAPVYFTLPFRTNTHGYAAFMAIVLINLERILADLNTFP